MITIATAAQEQRVTVYNATETESALLFAIALSENMTISYPSSARTAIKHAITAL